MFIPAKLYLTKFKAAAICRNQLHQSPLGGRFASEEFWCNGDLSPTMNESVPACLRSSKDCFPANRTGQMTNGHLNLQRLGSFSSTAQLCSCNTIPRESTSAQGGSLADKPEHNEGRLFCVDAGGRHGASFLANESPDS
jgi:hypothetical protein